MIYVFDSSPLIDLFRHYYQDRFPSLWRAFNHMAATNQITSTREVFNELKGHGDPLSMWCKANRQLFATPAPNELDVVKKIFEIEHFQMMIRRKNRMEGRPVADPFVVARAKCLEGCVVTAESDNPNAAKIPNVCRRFNMDCVQLEGFMERENWSF